MNSFCDPEGKYPKRLLVGGGGGGGETRDNQVPDIFLQKDDIGHL